MSVPSSDRTRLRRGASRAEYDRAAILAVLDAGMVAHVGVTTPEGPIVLPMAYGRTDEHVLLHGAAANAMLGHAVGADVCITVTVVDGLVIARSPFHNSMNYRCAVVRGEAAELREEDAKRAALAVITDHVVENWEAGRPPTAAELRRTRVLRVPLREMSGKIRAGDPGDEEADLDGPFWAGTVPIAATFGEPRSAADLRGHVAPPPAVTRLAGTDATRNQP